MRTLRLLALLLALALPAAAQGARTAHLAIGYDVATTTLTFTKMVGARGDQWAEPMKVNIAIDTTGSSQTVNAVTPGSNPFADLAVGDLLIVRRDNNVTDQVWIETKASDDQVTVDTAVDWSAGYTFEWLDLVTGTTTADGWISVTPGGTVALTVQYEAGDLAGLDVVWEAKEASPVSQAVRVYPGPNSTCGDGTLNTNVCTFTSTGDRLSVKWTNNHFSFYRLGLAYRTSDGGTREEVHAVLTSTKER